MSSSQDVARIVRSWLKEDLHEDADRVLDLVLEQLDTTPQRRLPWPVRRFSTMNRPLQIALAAAVLLAAVILGSRLLPANVGTAPSPSPTQQAPGAAAPLTYQATVQTLKAGVYSIAPGRYTPAKLTFRVSAGWDAQYLGLTKHGGETAEVGFNTWKVDHVYTDTCAASGKLKAIGPTVDDLVTALKSLGGATVSPPITTVVGGYSAKLMEITLPAVDVSKCRVPFLQIWADAALQDYFALLPRSQASVYVVDVSGQTLVITTNQGPSASDADVAELEAMLRSLKIEPAT